jgi:hypothetical protein
LAEVVSGLGRATAGEVVRTVTSALEQFLGRHDPADDVTLVAARIS